MPYSFSSSRTAAFQRVKDLRASFVHTQKCTKKIRSDVRQLVFQHCVIQTVAIFEDYIGDVISQWFYRLGTAGADAGKLPLDLRLHALANAMEHNYRDFVGDEDELKEVEKMNR